MKKTFTYLFLFFIGSFTMNAADDAHKKTYDSAEVFFNSKKYEQAIQKYLRLDAALKTNFNIKYKIGVCYLYSASEKQKAIPFLEQAAANSSAAHTGTLEDKTAPFISYNYLGKAYHLNYQFKEAITAFEKYKANVTDAVLVKATEHEIQIAKNAIEIYEIPMGLKIENMGKTVNSPYADFFPLLSADEATMIFTSRRNNSNKPDPKTGMHDEDIYMTTKTGEVWSKPTGIGSPINTPGNEAAVNLSIDGQKLIIYKEENGDGNLYTAQLKGNTWDYPQKLDEFINSKSNETSASLAADGNELYFTSDREGGFGGKDIYMSKKLPNGKWGRAINLGSDINTSYNEETPYIHPDGVTLFYSSEGQKGMGGYDIFFASRVTDTSKWTEPMNMGYPINTPDDDLFFVPTVGNNRAYYSSIKKDGFGNSDLYTIIFSNQKETPLTVYKGTVTGADGIIPAGAGVTVTNKESNEIIGEYSPNSSTGKFLFILNPGGNYNLSYTIDGNEVFSEDLSVPAGSVYSLTNKAVELKPVVLTAKK